MNTFTDKDIIRIFDKKINEICGKTIIRHTCQFFKKNHNKMNPFGSGVFVKSEQKYFIFTASHVAEYLNDENDLYIKVSHTEYINVTGQIWATKLDIDDKIDLAVIRIDEEMLEKLVKPYLFLPISKLRKHDRMYDAPHYAVVGYPAVNVKTENGRRKTGASIYLTKSSSEKVYKHYGFDKKLFYVLKMEGKGTNLSDGDKTKIDSQFHGISGCGLWLMFPHKRDGEYVVDYRLIGIMTEFRKGKYYCLIGNKVQLVVNLLVQLEQLKIRTVTKST